MVSPSDVVAQYRRKAAALYLVLIFGYSAYCIFEIWTALTRLDNPPTSTSSKDEAWDLPNLYISPTYDYPINLAFNTTGRCVFDRTFFQDVGLNQNALGWQCKHPDCFCKVELVDHPMLESKNKKAMKVNLADLVPKKQGAKVEIYIEYDAAPPTTCPPTSALLTTGKDFPYPILCSRNMVVDLMTKEYTAYPLQPWQTGQGRFTIQAGYSKVGVSNPAILTKTKSVKFVRNWKYFSGNPTADKDENINFLSRLSQQTFLFDSGHIAHLEINKKDYVLLTVETEEDMNIVRIVREINPMSWPKLLGQFGGFWVLVGILFQSLFVQKANMVPRWKRSEANIQNEVMMEKVNRLWDAYSARSAATSATATPALTPMPTGIPAALVKGNSGGLPKKMDDMQVYAV